MAAKKKRTTLPRVTLLAYNRRDLLAFSESVETLRLLVNDLRAVADSLERAAKRKAKPSTPSPAGVPTPSAG